MNLRRSLVAPLAMAALVSLAAVPAGAELPEDLALVELLTGLDRPLAARHAGDGSGRLFIVSQEGPIQIYVDEALLPTPFLDLTGVVENPFSFSETGLLGLAFHPDFASNGYFFVSYTVLDAGRKSRVVRYRVSEGNANVADVETATLIFEFPQFRSNHNGGNILFDRDGYLVIGLGDGGGQGDLGQNAQNPLTLLGKFLRIDVDVSTDPERGGEVCGTVANYGIPEDNPFAQQPGDGVCDEIWSIGFRNPWRWSFDRDSGDLFIGDVGNADVEEIDFEPAGAGGRNYGWACREGSEPRTFDECLPMPLNDPIIEYASDSPDCSVTGGYRYRGERIAGMGGLYVHADYCSGKIWFSQLAAGGNAVATELWDTTGYAISSFGEDEDGELYVVDIGGNNDTGRLFRFESASSIFTDGFEDGSLGAWGGDG